MDATTFTNTLSWATYVKQVKGSYNLDLGYSGQAIGTCMSVQSLWLFSLLGNLFRIFKNFTETRHERYVSCDERKDVIMGKNGYAFVHETNLCFCLTAHVQLLQAKRDMASKPTSKKPRYTVASWLEYIIVPSKFLLDSNCRLLDLHAAKYITHNSQNSNFPHWKEAKRQRTRTKYSSVTESKMDQEIARNSIRIHTSAQLHLTIQNSKGTHVGYFSLITKTEGSNFYTVYCLG